MRETNDFSASSSAFIIQFLSIFIGFQLLLLVTIKTIEARIPAKREVKIEINNQTDVVELKYDGSILELERGQVFTISVSKADDSPKNEVTIINSSDQMLKFQTTKLPSYTTEAITKVLLQDNNITVIDKNFNLSEMTLRLESLG